MAWRCWLMPGKHFTSGMLKEKGEVKINKENGKNLWIYTRRLVLFCFVIYLAAAFLLLICKALCLLRPDLGNSFRRSRSLMVRGINISCFLDLSGFGRGQVILRDLDSGILCGATEPRADGTVAAWELL